MNDAEDKLLMELRGLSRSFDKNSSENFKHSSDMLDYLKGKMDKKPKKGVKIEVKNEHKYDDSHQLPLDSRHPFYHASSSSSSSSLDKPFASSSAFNRPNFEINFDDEPHFPTSDYVVESAKKHNKRNRVQMPDNPSSRTLPESSSQDFSSDLLRIVNFIESMGPPHKWTNENKDELERFVEEGMSNLQTKSQQTQFLNTFQKELQRYKNSRPSESPNHGNLNQKFYNDPFRLAKASASGRQDADAVPLPDEFLPEHFKSKNRHSSSSSSNPLVRVPRDIEHISPFPNNDLNVSISDLRNRGSANNAMIPLSPSDSGYLTPIPLDYDMPLPPIRSFDRHPYISSDFNIPFSTIGKSSPQHIDFTMSNLFNQDEGDRRRVITHVLDDPFLSPLERSAELEASILFNQANEEHKSASRIVDPPQAQYIASSASDPEPIQQSPQSSPPDKIPPSPNQSFNSDNYDEMKKYVKKNLFGKDKFRQIFASNGNLLSFNAINFVAEKSGMAISDISDKFALRYIINMYEGKPNPPHSDSKKKSSKKSKKDR
jgi:hypothetical protein